MMKKKGRQGIALVLSAAMFLGMMGSTGFAASAQTDPASQTGRTDDAASRSRTDSARKESEGVPDQVSSGEESGGAMRLPESVKTWMKNEGLSDGFYGHIAATEQDAETLRLSDESANVLVTSADADLTGITAGSVTGAGKEKLDIYESKMSDLTVLGTKTVVLNGVETDHLTIRAEKGENVRVQSDRETKIPDIAVEGSGSVTIEGNGSFGLVRVTDIMQELTVRATCSVVNGTGGTVPVTGPDGSRDQLQAGEQKELVLSEYLISFEADGRTVDTELVKPGEAVVFPDSVPEKEGYVFTAWYRDEAFSESVSQFETAQGQAAYYARYVPENETVTVQFDTQGGSPLSPVTMAKGETLLTRSTKDIYTTKEGYTFGGWCLDPECTLSFAFSEPVEKSLTLYAFFVSDEIQSEEQEGNSTELKDFEWNGTIRLTAPENMTADEVKGAISVEAGSGEEDPSFVITGEDGENGGYLLSGSCYEQDGEKGFEPGSTFTLTAADDVHFTDYPEEITTLVVSVYKETVETVSFSSDMDYVLWDDVVSYVPAKEQGTAGELTGDAEKDLDAETAEEEEVADKADAETAAGASGQAEQPRTEQTEADQQKNAGEAQTETGEESADEWEMPAYTPGEIVVSGSDSYQKGDLVAFYDGSIDRDEKTMDTWEGGSYDGYVLYAKVASAEKTSDGTRISFEYASPEEYLADFNVHMTEDADMEDRLSDEDLSSVRAQLTRQVQENDELKAQMLVSVMSSKETQKLLDEKYGEGAYALAAMGASLTVGKPSVRLSVSGSSVTAKISVSATARISKDGKLLLTVQPKLSFSETLQVKLSVDGGKFWIDMSTSLLSTTRIELTVSASSGRNVSSVFAGAKETLEDLVKPEGIDGTYEEYDSAVTDLMDTMSSIVSTSLKYNDIFDVTLLTMSYSFYGIITVGVEVHFVGQVGVLATFGVEIVAVSGERIGFNYNFTKFKGNSYTEKLDSSVTSNIYLIGKVGVRAGARLILSITICGIVRTSIAGNLYVYAELTGLYFLTTNLLSGTSSGLGAVHFEIGIDVVVNLSLQVNLLVKTVRKSWNVYKGRWPLWSKSLSSTLSYMNEEEMASEWEKQAAIADSRTVFGFTTIPVKTWNLISGNCLNQGLLPGASFGNGARVTLAVENLVVNGETVPEGDPKNGLFKIGDAGSGQNPFCIYLDENVAAEQLCETASLDLAVTYENRSVSALVKKQVRKFHLERTVSLATTTQHVRVALYDWCAAEWNLPAASWDNAVVYETDMVSSHTLSSVYTPTATGILSRGEALAAAQQAYPEIAGMTTSWNRPLSGSDIQYGTPNYSSFCYMTADNGVVRYDVRPQTDAYTITYYLFVRRFEGEDSTVRYHVRLDRAEKGDTYAFSVKKKEGGDEEPFVQEKDGTYLLTAQRGQFDTTGQALMMSVNGSEPFKTGFVITGQEMRQDVWFDITANGRLRLGITAEEGVESCEFADPSIVKDSGIVPGTMVELKVKLKDGYGGLEAVCDNSSVDISIGEDGTVRFTMPADSISLTLRAYRMHRVTYLYHYKAYGTYETVWYTEKETTEKPEDPEIADLTFRGWYLSPEYEGAPYEFGQTPDTDITLYADWTCDVTVHLAPAKGKAAYLEDGTEHPFFEDASAEYDTYTFSLQRPGEKLPEIVLPEYEGYQFMGWYAESDFSGDEVELSGSGYTVNGGMDLYARWAKELKVTFDRNDGSGDGTSYAEVTGYAGFALPLVPDDPVREHYTFTGWYYDRPTKDHPAMRPFDVKNDLLRWDITVYAGWEAKVYTIRYELDGGTNDAKNPDHYTCEDDVFTLEEPFRYGYDFRGWTGTGLGDDIAEKITVRPEEGGDRVYKAVWEPHVYTIEYHRTFEAAEENPTEYTIESGEITLKEPSREGYTFVGWIEEIKDGDPGKESKPEKNVIIPAGSTGSRVYTAVWETDDPVQQILERVYQIAGANPYEGNLADYLDADDFSGEGGRDYGKIEGTGEDEGTLARNMKAALEKLIRNDTGDTGISVYGDQIRLSFTFEKADRTTSPDEQTYTFRLSASYIDDDENEIPSNPEAEDAQAVLKKIVPEIAASPQSTNLKYGQNVGDSSLSGGGAKYTYTGQTGTASDSYSVKGTFTWKDDEKTKIPFGRNNGTKDSEYTAVFTPVSSDADAFAPAECRVGVRTQIGLYVTGSAGTDGKISYAFDETTGRAFISCPGSLKLVYVKEDGTEGTEELTDGWQGLKLTVSGTSVTGNGSCTWTLDSGDVGTHTATCANIALDESGNRDDLYGAGAYVLVNPTVTQKGVTVSQSVEVTQVTDFRGAGAGDQRNSSIETAEKSYPYGTALKDISFENEGQALAHYRDSAAEGRGTNQNVSGTLRWANDVDGEQKPQASADPKKYKVTFVPDEKYHNGYKVVEGGITCEVTIEKAKVEIPDVSDKTYNGNQQSSGLSETDFYKVSDTGGVNAGVYSVTLSLKDTTNYVWSRNGWGKSSEDQKIVYRIQKADLTAHGTASDIQMLLYGQLLTGSDSSLNGKNSAEKSVTQALSASDMLKNYRASYKDEADRDVTAQGKWNWDANKMTAYLSNAEVTAQEGGTESKLAQPLSVREEPYWIKVTFTPADSANLNILKTYLPVRVQKSVPLVIENTAPAAAEHVFYQPKDKPVNSLQDNAGGIVNAPSVCNQYSPNSDLISGTWDWSDGPFKPNRTAEGEQTVQCPITFTPSDQSNYDIAPGNCNVTLTNVLTVSESLTLSGSGGRTDQKTSRYELDTLKGEVGIPIGTLDSTDWHLKRVTVSWKVGSSMQTQCTAACAAADDKVTSYSQQNVIQVNVTKQGLTQPRVTVRFLKDPTNDVRIEVVAAKASDFGTAGAKRAPALLPDTDPENRMPEAETQPDAGEPANTETALPQETKPAEASAGEVQTETNAQAGTEKETASSGMQAPETQTPAPQTTETAAPVPQPETQAPAPQPQPETAAPQPETQAPAPQPETAAPAPAAPEPVPETAAEAETHAETAAESAA